MRRWWSLGRHTHTHICSKSQEGAGMVGGCSDRPWLEPILRQGALGVEQYVGLQISEACLTPASECCAVCVTAICPEGKNLSLSART